MPATVLDIARAFQRSFYIQATFTSERMLALGYAFCLLPFLRKLGASDAEMHDILRDNLKYFNTNPYVTTWVLGAEMNLHERRLVGKGPVTEEVERFRKRMSQALAGPGDNLFWATLRPVSALLSVLVALASPAAALATIFATFSVPSFFVRLSGAVRGYRRGLGIITENDSRRYNQVAMILLKVGAFVLGPAALLLGSQMLGGGRMAPITVLLAGGLMYFLLRRGWSVTSNLLILLTGVVLVTMVFEIFSAT